MKLPGQKRFAPLGSDIDGNLCLAGNLLCAFIYTVNSDEEKAKLEEKAKSLETLNPGSQAELRPVKGW